ncbi:MAG: WecB/TagA/CpsF family glycosyltransferase [Oscillospiraceae bacterium]|jgi:N-acetylglucosaminyldiphosphoundecaprenol N-acetyl-beta-D-mannosaminyltransferase|nr:WecB/TagA/CpsF family glycosyltransferase [Oscillospiraceae bacterium]
MREPRVNIIGVPISAVNMESCIKNIFANWEAACGNYICVSNVHTTVMAHNHPEYLKIQKDSFLSVPDGKPLSVLGKKQYPEMGRVTGPDLMRRIFEESKVRPLRHYFYGNTREHLDQLLQKLAVDYPWVKIVGSEPSVFRDMTPQEEQQLVERINSTNPDFVWVALGAPRQEFFCSRMKGKIQGLMVGVGGAFNVLAGIVPEAPKWMQNCSLEWLYRLMQEPRRLFKRYFATNLEFIFYLIH